MTAPIEVVRRRVSLVVRAVDAFRQARGRRPDQFRAMGALRFCIAQQRVDGAWQRLARPRRDVLNLSGDSVFLDLDLPAGRYRLAPHPCEARWTGPGIPRAHRPASEVYEELTPGDLEIDWDPNDATERLEFDGRPHPARLFPVLRRPGVAYPFPSRTTLIRVTLAWFDGLGMPGARVRHEATGVSARTNRSGEAVLAFTDASAVGAQIELELDFTGVETDGRADRQAYLDDWPTAWADVEVARGASVSVSQGRIWGRVLRANGGPAAGARVTVESGGRDLPSPVMVDASSGRWEYAFVPPTEARVSLRVEHPEFAPHAVEGIEPRGGAQVEVPVVRLR